MCIIMNIKRMQEESMTKSAKNRRRRERQAEAKEQALSKPVGMLEKYNQQASTTIKAAVVSAMKEKKSEPKPAGKRSTKRWLKYVFGAGLMAGAGYGIYKLHKRYKQRNVIDLTRDMASSEMNLNIPEENLPDIIRFNVNPNSDTNVSSV